MIVLALVTVLRGKPAGCLGASRPGLLTAHVKFA